MDRAVQAGYVLLHSTESKELEVEKLYVKRSDLYSLLMDQHN